MVFRNGSQQDYQLKLILLIKLPLKPMEIILRSRPSAWLTAFFLGLVGMSQITAMAADMSTDELRKFLIGRTYYLEVASGGTLATTGQAALYFDSNGLVLNRVPSGKIQQGAWTIQNNMVCVVWKDLASNPCSRYDKEGDIVYVINMATGQRRGKIIKSADGNAENLVP